jgi:hypothetical protein
MGFLGKKACVDSNAISTSARVFNGSPLPLTVKHKAPQLAPKTIQWGHPLYLHHHQTLTPVWVTCVTKQPR